MQDGSRRPSRRLTALPPESQIGRKRKPNWPRKRITRIVTGWPRFFGLRGRRCCTSGYPDLSSRMQGGSPGSVTLNRSGYASILGFCSLRVEPGRLHVGRPYEARHEPSDAPARVRAAGSRRKGVQRRDLQDTVFGPGECGERRTDGRLFAGRLSGSGSVRADRAVARSARGPSPGRPEPGACPACCRTKAACAAQAREAIAGTQATRRTEAGPLKVGRSQASRSPAATGTGGGPAATFCAGTCSIAGGAVAGPATVLAPARAKLAVADSATHAAIVWRPIRPNRPGRFASGSAGAAWAFFLYCLQTEPSRCRRREPGKPWWGIVAEPSDPRF